MAQLKSVLGYLEKKCVRTGQLKNVSKLIFHPFFHNCQIFFLLPITGELSLSESIGLFYIRCGILIIFKNDSFHSNKKE